MAIEVEDLSTLDAAAVQQNVEELSARLLELNPNLDLKRGVLHDLLSYYHGTLSTAEQVSLNRYLNARSLRVIEQDPTLADDGVVDDILSNFRLTRKSGSAANGEVVIVVGASNTVVISAGAVFEANGKQFTADEVFTAKIEASQVVASGDRLLTAIGDGDYAFTINVTAIDEGPDFLIAKDTLMVPLVPPREFVTAYAASDFTDGLNEETNAELIERLQQGIAARAPSNRVNMNAMLRDIEAFSRVVRTSIIGYGDVEMLRDKHSILPLSLGGRADWYVRTQERLLHTALTKEATLISVDGDGVGTWQFGLGRDEVPGFYEVSLVRPAGSTNTAGTLEIVADVRSTDLTGTGFIPDIVTAAEGAYSRYQTAVIKFKDDTVDDEATAVGTKRNYDVEIRMLPQIGDIQDELSTLDLRSYGADILIKAPIPCFMKLGLVINRQNVTGSIDTDAIANALAAEVNNTRFLGRLFASQLHDVVQGFLDNDTSAGAIDMFGRIRRPDGTLLYVRDKEVLEVPEEDGTMVSPRTVQFFLEPGNVAISVATTVPTPM